MIGRHASSRVASVLAVGGLFLVSAACDDLFDRDPAAPIDPPEAIAWGDCPPHLPDGPGGLPLECGTVEAPLDYSDPNGMSIEIAVSRLLTSDPEKRRGVLLLNPGGPGAGGLRMPVSVAGSLPPEVLERYDLIGFDPRGVQYSAGVSCGFTEDERAQVDPTHPVSPADVETRFELVKGLAAKCQNHGDSHLLPYITTANTARDMDRLRQALDEERISYLGGSYGSYLGAVYAALFPDHSDRIVLHGVVGPNMVWQESMRLRSYGGELVFEVFTEWAARHHDYYGLGSTASEVRQTYFRLVEQLDREPLPECDGTWFRRSTWIWSPGRFPGLAELWREVDTGGSPSCVVGQMGSLPGEIPPDNVQASHSAVVCGDASWPTSVAQYQHDVAVDRELFPVFGALWANVWICAAWPTPPMEPPVRITDQGPANVLLLQKTRDATTTYPEAVDMRAAFGQRARLVTVDEVGHGVFGSGFGDSHVNDCASDIATRYLVDGYFPETDLFCPNEIDYDAIRPGGPGGPGGPVPPGEE